MQLCCTARDADFEHSSVVTPRQPWCRLIHLDEPGQCGWPTLEALAIDNAIEGCVRETLGAIEAVWMAEHSPDPEIRSVMRSIARDEERHAALAWRIDAWVRGHVDAAPIDAAMRNAIEVLERQSPYSAELVAIGLPDATRTAAMVQGLRERLWRSAA